MMISDMYVVEVQEGLETKNYNVLAGNRTEAGRAVMRNYPGVKVTGIQKYQNGLIIDTSIVRGMVATGRRIGGK